LPIGRLGAEGRNPEFPEDPYLGLALAIRIAPPHPVAIVKRYLPRQEDIADHKCTSPFTGISCLSPLDDSEPDTLDYSGIGSTSEN